MIVYIGSKSDGSTNIAQDGNNPRPDFGPLWRTLWLCVSPCFLGFILATDSILDSINDVNAKTFFFSESYFKPLGSKISPRILLRGNWESEVSSPEEGRDQFCVEMIGWGDENKWNRVGMEYFKGDDKNIKWVRMREISAPLYFLGGMIL